MLRISVVSDLRPKALLVELQGLSYAPPSRAARGMIAASAPSGVKPRRSERSGACPPARALRRAARAGRSSVAHDLAVDLDRRPARSAAAPRSSSRARAARRAAPAGARGSPSGSGTSGTSSGASPSPDDAREVRPPPRARPPRPCERATMNRASASFASSGSPAGGSRSADEPVPLRRAARPGSASSGRTSPRAARSAGCCCRPTSSSSSPSHESRSGVVSDDLRLEPVVPPSPRGRRAGCRAGRCRRARRRPRSRPSRRPASAGRAAPRPRSARCAA